MMIEKPKTRWQEATRWQDQTVLTLLEKLARERPLQPDEMTLLSRTMHRLKPKREVWRWGANEDRQILDLLHRRKRLGRPKPFEKNDEIRLLAEKLKRTPWAVYRRMERLRKSLKCSDAAKTESKVA